MSGFLLDTNVISELGRGARANVGVVAWFSAAEESTLHLSVITLGEIRKGIEKLEDATRKAALETFFAAMKRRFAGRILALDERVADRWGYVMGRAARAGAAPAAIDSLLAATALEYNLTLVTRNVRDFRSVDVPLVDPFEETS